jgi:hypothetical protein
MKDALTLLSEEVQARMPANLPGADPIKELCKIVVEVISEWEQSHPELAREAKAMLMEKKN